MSEGFQAPPVPDIPAFPSPPEPPPVPPVPPPYPVESLSDDTVNRYPRHENASYIALLFFFVALLSGAVFRTLLKNSPLPYTVALLLLGCVIGFVSAGSDLGLLSDSLEKWAAIDPQLIMVAFIPGLVFETAFSIHWPLFRGAMAQVLLLATAGVLLSAAFIGAVLHWVFPYEWELDFSLMIGAMLSATDPVAVVALLNDVGGSKKLRMVIEGESLLNDGAAIMMFQLFLDLAIGVPMTEADVTVFFLQTVVAGPAIGLAVGMATLAWLGYVYIGRKVGDDSVIDISLTLVACYITFFVAEICSNSSGILAVVTLGTLFSAKGLGYFSPRADVNSSVTAFWGIITYIGNTVIFILNGVLIARLIFSESPLLRPSDAGWAVLLYLTLLAGRGLMILVLFPALQRLGFGLDWRGAVVLWWGGLRGAIGLALAIWAFKVKRFGERDQALLVFHTGIQVVMGVLINGMSCRRLIQYLGLDVVDPEEEEGDLGLGDRARSGSEDSESLESTKLVLRGEARSSSSGRQRGFVNFGSKFPKRKVAKPGPPEASPYGTTAKETFDELRGKEGEMP